MPCLAVGAVNGFRFRRPPLAQHNAEHHHDADREKLTLPRSAALGGITTVRLVLDGYRTLTASRTAMTRWG